MDVLKTFKCKSGKFEVFFYVSDNHFNTTVF